MAELPKGVVGAAVKAAYELGVPSMSDDRVAAMERALTTVLPAIRDQVREEAEQAWAVERETIQEALKDWHPGLGTPEQFVSKRLSDSATVYRLEGVAELLDQAAQQERERLREALTDEAERLEKTEDEHPGAKAILDFLETDAVLSTSQPETESAWPIRLRRGQIDGLLRLLGVQMEQDGGREQAHESWLEIDRTLRSARDDAPPMSSQPEEGEKCKTCSDSKEVRELHQAAWAAPCAIVPKPCPDCSTPHVADSARLTKEGKRFWAWRIPAWGTGWHIYDTDLPDRLEQALRSDKVEVIELVPVGSTSQVGDGVADWRENCSRYPDCGCTKLCPGFPPRTSQVGEGGD